MIALLTYFAAHWTLVIAVVLTVAAIGIAAFFLKNWKLGVMAIAIAVIGFAYQGAVTSGIELQMAKESAAKVELLEGRLKTLGDITLRDSKRAETDAKKIDELEKLASETPKNDGACLDAAAASRVQRTR